MRLWNTVLGRMKLGFLVMMKTLQVGLGENLRKFSITISKSTQNLWLWNTVRLWNTVLGRMKLGFSIEYDRAKRHERIGKNGIENRLTVWILCAKR